VRERNSLFGLLLVFGTCNFLFGIAAITITPLVLSMADPALLGVQMSIGGAGLLLGGVLMAASGGEEAHQRRAGLFPAGGAGPGRARPGAVFSCW
jgi:hypothetical protein